jgi:hypothetical protein
MPTIATADALLQEALNLVEEYGSGHLVVKALGKRAKVSKTTIDKRATCARLKGMRPAVRKDEPRVYTKARLGRMHCLIPDVQARPGVRIDHLEWVGKFIADKRPDVIVQIGDFADLPSLSKYDRNTLRGENKRLKRDIDFADEAMRTLVAPFKDIPGYHPEMHLTMGNHEDRLDRFVNETPFLEEIIGTHQLDYAKYGWKVHPFLKTVCIDGIIYVHYFISGARGMAVSSAPALLRLQKRSAVMGHNQKTDVAFHPVTHQWAIFCGVCNLHDEPYLTPQGNDVRRQIIVFHEVEDGKADPMFVSLRFLEKAYG